MLGFERFEDKALVAVIVRGILERVLGFLPLETLVKDKNNYLAQEYNLHYTQALPLEGLSQ